MKLLDWLFFTFYHATINRGSRFERANFALWFSSSFLWVAVFYLILTLLSIRIVKPLFMLVFLTIFMINLFLLKRVYIKAERGKQVVKNKVVTEGYALFARLFIFISIITSMAIMLTMMIYYGKNVGYV